MELRRLTQDDIDYVKPRSISGGNFKMPSEFEWDFALVDEGKTLGIGGIGLLTLTTAFCWLDMAEDAKGKLLTVYRLLKEFIFKLAKTQKIRRLEAYVDCSFPEGIRLVEHLGYKRECVCEKVLGDKPAYRYVLFLEET